MKHNLWNRLKSDRGLSFIETLISLFLLSLISIMLFRLGTSLMPQFTRDHQSGLNHYRQVQILRVLILELDKVNPPWWIKEYPLEIEEDCWIFPWYKGIEEQQLKLERYNHQLIIHPGSEPPISIPYEGIFEIEQLVLGKRGILICQIILGSKKRYLPIGGIL